MPNGNGNDAVPAVQKLPAARRSRAKLRISKYTASIHFSPADPAKASIGVPRAFVRLIQQLEAKLEMPIWLMIQNGRGKYCEIDADTFKGFQKRRDEIADDAPVALLIESPGGIPDNAYYIARYFQRRASKFLTIVPQYAKSAATLLALGGNEILMGRDAELGPLDVQMYDSARERYGSALNTLQSLERLHADVMSAFDETMQLLIFRTGKKIDMLMPTVLTHATEFVTPLVEKIDTLDYTEKSRAMKMAEEYAVRLMRGAGYDRVVAEAVARKLVSGYPDHGFIIDADEARKIDRLPSGEIGLSITMADAEVERIFGELIPFLDSLTAVGRLQEMGS